MNVTIIGATSGIGRALAELYAAKGYKVGVTGRRSELLDELKQAFPNNIYTKAFDVLADNSTDKLQELIDEMGGVDLAIISSGVGKVNRTLDWKVEHATAMVNVVGFTRMADYLYLYFQQKGSGHLTAISSIASIRGIDLCPSYSASKSYISIYLEALRRKSTKEKNGVAISTIIPGFIDTPFLTADTPTFWKANVTKAAKQMVAGLKRKKRRIYVTKRWRWVAMLLRRLPACLQERI